LRFAIRLNSRVEGVFFEQKGGRSVRRKVTSFRSNKKKKVTNIYRDIWGEMRHTFARIHKRTPKLSERATLRIHKKRIKEEKKGIRV
jgi:hypothetical protein